MLLSEGSSVGPMMRVAFTGFVVFWVVVLVGLFLGVGFLLKHYDRRGHRSVHSDSAH